MGTKLCFGSQKKVRGKIVKGKKVNRKWDDCFSVWYKWKWKERKSYA